MKILRIPLFLLLSVSLANAEDFRTWDTIGGGSFEAKLNAVGNTTITIENREGSIVEFPLSDLKPSSQKFAKNWQTEQSSTGNTSSVANPENRSDFANLVYKNLVYSKGKRLARFTADPSDQPQYFAFYRSALWCPPCRTFTPNLVKFYDKQKSTGAAFELVFISSDKSEDSMAEYMNDYNMQWPAFPHGKNKNIVQSNGGGIPNLIITDAEGNKLLDSYDESGKYIGPSAVMEKFEKMLQATL
ncbi:MAG: thioredoxin-like domain-containing protein [Opitutaceae bacterium]